MPDHDNEVASQRSPILDAHGPDPVPADIAEPLPGGAKVDLVLDGDHAVQWLGGDIDASNSGRLVDIGSLALADPRVDSLVVDLSAVTFLDSSGLGAMVQLRKQARTAQKQLTLRGVPPVVAKVFHLTGLDELFGLTNADAGRC